MFFVDQRIPVYQQYCVMLSWATFTALTLLLEQNRCFGIRVPWNFLCRRHYRSSYGKIATAILS